MLEAAIIPNGLVYISLLRTKVSSAYASITICCQILKYRYFKYVMRIFYKWHSYQL